MTTLPLSAGVIGWPIAHSKSPLIHRYWLAKLGIDGDYSRLPVHPDNLAAVIRALPSLGLRGVNVTIPHKISAIEHVDVLDNEVKNVGALNCIVVSSSGQTCGYNTDVVGIYNAISHLDLHGRRAVVIGGGGAARAAIAALLNLNIDHIDIWNRSPKNADQALVDANANGAVFHLDTPLPPDAAIVLNATSLGMVGFPSLNLSLDTLHPDTVVFDMVYNPVRTSLLARGHARGLPTIDGLTMLIGQAAAAFELFFDAAAPREYDAELRALLSA